MSRSFDPLKKLKESDRVNVRDWLANLTYAEVHEFTKGAGLALLAGLSQWQLMWKLVAAYALVVTGIVHADAIEALDSVDKREDHYFLGGVIAGSVLAVVMGVELV